MFLFFMKITRMMYILKLIMREVIYVQSKLHLHKDTFLMIYIYNIFVGYVVLEICTTIYYPPRDVFALNTGKYRLGCIFFVYTGAPVLWILSVINFRFFNNISESM